MTAATSQPTWFGQPRGLTILFMTNMWEQFSYYGMRALLVYYMTKQLMMGQGHSSFVYGAYTACAYFTPILGGVIADRLLGKRRAVIIGASVMAIGHFMMAFEPLFYVALTTIAIGNGLFLPSLPSQINDLYAADDPRRSGAYNIYYVGINIGGFLAPLVCGTLGEFYGWHYGFGAAGIGMFVGLVIYILGQRYLPPEPERPKIDDQPRAHWADYRQVIGILVALGLSVAVLRGAYEQAGNTIAIWADSGVDRAIGDFVIPMTWFQSLNPLMVMLMTPPLLAWWHRRAAAGHDLSPARRMSAGALIVAAAYVLLACIAAMHRDGQAPWIWFVAFFGLFTLGELFVLPTGLGLFARLAPPRFGATTVAAWFLASFVGSLTAGFVGMVWTHTTPAMFFAMLSAIAMIAAALLRALDKPVRAIDPTWPHGD